MKMKPKKKSKRKQGRAVVPSPETVDQQAPQTAQSTSSHEDLSDNNHNDLVPDPPQIEHKQTINRGEHITDLKSFFASRFEEFINQIEPPSPGDKRKFSEDGKQYIEGEWQDTRLTELTSCQLVHPSTNSVFYVRKQKNNYLLTFDETDFVARIKISQLNGIDNSKPFEDITKVFLRKITVVKILEDSLLNQNQANYETLIKHFNVTNRQELIQVSVVLDKFRHKYSPPSNGQMLTELVNNQLLSQNLRNSAEDLLKSEQAFLDRNSSFFKFDLSVKDLFKDLDQVYRNGVQNHKKLLLNRCPSYGSPIALNIISKLHELPDNRILYLSCEDISLFSDLIEATNQFKEPIQIFIDILVQQLLQRLLNVKKLEPLTNPIYSYLCKSFLGIVGRISERTEISVDDLILVNNHGEWTLNDKIAWTSTSALTYSLERQYRFIFELMSHFEPGLCFEKNTFEYNPHDEILFTKTTKKWYKILNSTSKPSLKYVTNQPDVSEMSEERKVWFYILDDSVQSILTYQSCQPGFSEESKRRFQELINPIMKCYTEFVHEAAEDRFESFRVAAHSITRFIAQISPYLFKFISELTIDQSILEKQTAVIRKMMFASHENDNFADQFMSLINAYSDYWEARESILMKISERFTRTKLEPQMKSIFEKLLKIVDVGLGKEVAIQVQVNYFRAFNECLNFLKAIEFKWFVKKSDIPEGLVGDVIELVNEDKQSYEVLDPKAFISKCNSNPPEHYQVNVVHDLLDIISRFQETRDWTDNVRLNATSDLLLAIGRSFLHFKEQAFYVSFDQFQIDSTKPFESVASSSTTFEDFKGRLDNVENFYLYTRKQNEIDIAKALDLFCEEASLASQSNFDASLDRELLLRAYEKYEKEFAKYVDWSEKSIVDGIQEKLEKFEILDIEKWTPEFKQNSLPICLAALAAVWSKQASQDVVSTGMSLKPHCIQILCVLRLLSVDKSDSGVFKQLAQVLTGQGKSIVLGLLSALLALTGHKVRVVCYSDYLAKRDELDFEDFFETFEIEDRITYGTFDGMANDLINININGQKENLRTLVQNLVGNKLENQSSESKNNDVSKTILLIDEVDVFFTEEFYGETYNPVAAIGMQALVDIQTKIWKLVESGAHVEKVVIAKVKEQINEIIRNNEDKEFINFIRTIRTFFDFHLNKMVINAITVGQASENDWIVSRHKIDEKGLISFKDNNGLFCTATCYEYYNVFIYFQLKKKDFDHKNFANFGYLFLDCGSISYAELPNEYPVILGVSGTLTTLNSAEIKAVKSYGIHQTSSMPSFFGRQKLEFDEHSDFTLLESEDNWLREIFNHIDSKIQSGRAVLVFFDTETEINKFKTQYQSKINLLHVLTGNEKKSDMEWSINEAGVAQSVTLATKLMGRGVDFKSNDSSVEAKGGVHVIQTFFSLDEKEEVQIKGRTARKDNKGSYELVICQNHLKAIGCFYKCDYTPVSNFQELNSVRKLKAEETRKNDIERIQKSNEKHVKTMKFLKSFAKYTPDKRSKYFLEYPLVEE